MIRRWLLLLALGALAHGAFAQTIATMTPSTAVAGSGPLTLTLTGKFPPSSGTPFVEWSVPATEQQYQLNITSSTPTQIVATIPANLLTQPETAQVSVLQGDTYSNQETFTVTSPPPTLSSLSPNSAVAGSPAITLTVTGANFPANLPNGLFVTWNGTSLQTSYVNSGQLTASVPASLLANAGTASVSISTQPAPTPLTFTITPPPLVLTSISPTSVSYGGPAFSLTVNGSGFSNVTTVTWNGSALPTTFVSSAQLTAVVPASLIGLPGGVSVDVSASGQASPSALTLTITPNPAIKSISPNSATAGGPGFTLTVSGEGFGNGVTAYWNSTALTTSVVNVGQLTASVPASLIAQAGTASITAHFGNLVSNQAAFTINPAPLALSSISPSTAVAGSAAFTLTANGTGFAYYTALTWNGSALSTAFVSATQLTATVPASLITTPGTASVGVTSPGQTAPSPLTFTITPNLTLSTLSPATALAGGPAFTLTVNGSGFDSGTTLYWNNTALSLTSVTATQMMASVPAALTAQPGTASITAQARGLVSNALPFTITTVPVTLTSLSPNTTAAGGPAFTLTATGTGFSSGSIITWNGLSLSTSFLSATLLTASVPANLIASPGTIYVGVSVPGQVSPTPLTFTVTPGLTLTSLSPSSTSAGGAAFTLTVTGAGFTTGTSLFWNGTALSTTILSATQMSATVPANLIAQAGTASITAQSGNLLSNALVFSITTAQTVTLTSLSPNSAPAGSPAFTLTVNGSGFTYASLAIGTQVTWNGTALTTSFVSPTQLTAQVPANLLTTPGTAAVSVTGSPQPSSLPFTILSPLTLTSISPTRVQAGGAAFTLTANGTGFSSTTSVTWNGSPLTTTFVSSIQLTAAVPASLIVAAGTVSIDVTAPANQATPAALQLVVTANPILTSLSPASTVAGGPAFTLTVNGSGFVTGATVLWNNTALATTYVSSTQLTAAVSAGLIAQAGSVSITANVGNAVSNALTFTITAPAPVITSISPSSVTAGGGAFTLTANGTGFAAGAVVSLNSAALATTFVSTTQVIAAVPASAIAQPGTAQVTLANASGSASNAVPLTIALPVPTITSISPASVTAGGAAFTLTVNGTGFAAGATVSLNGTALTTTFVSATQLTASVPASAIAKAGPVAVTVANTGGAASNAVTLTITVPIPTITTISPVTVVAGSPAFTLSVFGSNFPNGAIVSLNTTPLITAFVSVTQLTASVPASLIAQPGTVQITVSNVGGAASNAVSLGITAPVPTLTSISPATVPLGGPAFTLTVNGSNFFSGATVYLGTSPLPTTVVSVTQLTTLVPASLVQQPATLQVTVTNTGTAPSNPLTLTVLSPTPTITSITPSSVTAGGPAFTLTINGTGFTAGVPVLISGTALSSTVVSSTQLTTTVPASLIAQPGAAQVSVGGSNALTLTITSPLPTLTSLAPSSANVGDPAFTLTVTGTGFAPGSVVQWNGAALSTTFVSPTQLTALVDAGRLSVPGTASVTVVNQVPGGPAQVSNSLPFTINAVTPTITSLSPNSATVGGPAFSLIVTGTGFVSLTSIQWNTTALNTHFVSATSVTADVPASLIAQTGTVNVTAINPGNIVSAALTFTIIPPPPAVITSLSQTSATAGSAAFTLTVTGTGFTSGAVVNLGTTALTTTFVSATQLTATVTANLLLTPGTYSITVQQTSTTSNPENFAVNLPAPPALRLNPPSAVGPAQQPTIDFGLNSAYPLALNGTVTLTFASNATVPTDDPSIQFATGGRTFSFTVPANSTTLPALLVQTGTVAGVITLNVALTAAGVNVTPATGASATITIAKAAPVIQNVSLIHANGYLEVDVTGFSTTRDMTTAVFQLNAAPGGSFTSSVLTVPVSSLFTTWYQSSASSTFGSQFTYAQPFTVIGDTNQIASVTVTLTNSTGTSISTTSH